MGAPMAKPRHRPLGVYDQAASQIIIPTGFSGQQEIPFQITRGVMSSRPRQYYEAFHKVAR